MKIIIYAIVLIVQLKPANSYCQTNVDTSKGSLSFVNGKMEGKFYGSAVTSAIVESNNYWNLASVYAQSSNFSKNRNWFEEYIKVGAKFSYNSNEHLKLYSEVSIVASGTLIKDVFDQGNSGRILPENAYLGLEYKFKKSSVDISVGQQNFTIGTGMLISVGAGNGFERGAVTLMPRSAWKMSGIAKYNSKFFTVKGFILDNNELDAPNNNNNRVAGGNIEFRANKILKQFGFAYLNMINSTMVYPQGLTIIPEGRKDLQVAHGYLSINPFEKKLPMFSFGFEYAYEWKSNINMKAYGGGVSISNMFLKLPWTPKLRYSYRVFSGDDPKTSKLERFDPLFYNGSPDGWASGGNASLTFYNSNINTHILALDLYPSKRDIIQLIYWNLQANKLNSPIQFGQAARVGSDGVSIVVGVEDRKLANDFYLGYTRIVTSKFFVSIGLAESLPGNGLKLLAPDKVAAWTGGFLSLIFNL